MSEPVYCLATFEHYYAHMHETVEALRERGVDVQVVTSNKKAMWGGEYVHPAKRDPRGLWIVAGAADAIGVPGRRIVYVEHGAGQTYEADSRGVGHVSYSSGVIPGAVLFLCPNEYVAARRRRNHPDAMVEVVGTPKLDHLHAHLTGQHDGVDENVVAFAFHWDCPLMPETMSAWEHYRSGMVKVSLALHRRGIRCVAHSHPRIARRVRYHLERAGMEWWDAEEVLTSAQCLVADNTSLMYEFASLDRPVVVMNAPWYRRGVHHGLRFWECIPGLQVSDPWEIPETVIESIEAEADGVGREFRSCVDKVYPLRDGKAAARSAEAILSVL